MSKQALLMIWASVARSYNVPDAYPVTQIASFWYCISRLCTALTLFEVKVNALLEL